MPSGSVNLKTKMLVSLDVDLGSVSVCLGECVESVGLVSLKPYVGADASR
jgi:hypothetical protein